MEELVTEAREVDMIYRENGQLRQKPVDLEEEINL